MLIAHPLRDLYCSLNNVVRRQRQLLAARLCRYLNLATALKIVHQDERLGDAPSVSQSAVITQKHHPLVSKIDDKFSLLLGTKSRAVVIVVSDLAVKRNPELVQREQALLLSGNRRASDCVEMHDALRLRNRVVNHAMDDPSRRD